MVLAVSLPWWAILYLTLFLGLTLIGAATDYRDKKAAILGDFMSCGFACICVFSYFDISLAQSVGYWLIPMVLIGLAWEFASAVSDANFAEAEMKQERDITDEDRSLLLNLGISMGALIVLPACMMGAKVCFDLFFPPLAG